MKFFNWISKEDVDELKRELDSVKKQVAKFEKDVDVQASTIVVLSDHIIKLQKLLSNVSTEYVETKKALDYVLELLTSTDKLDYEKEEPYAKQELSGKKKSELN